MINLLYVDLFCGAGGTSTGVELARVNGEQCAKVVACVNHDKNAIASHAANHPDALHFTEDIRTLELSPLVTHVNRMKQMYPEAHLVLWASLECTNFSKAKGGLPRDADSRTLAEHLFRYIEALHPSYIQIENVEEFMSWGDLDENGKPVSKDKGQLYLRWVDRVQYGYLPRHGCGQVRHDELYTVFRNGNLLDKVYDFDHRILNAADFGAYTTRKRFFGIFAKEGLPIVFPKPTHSKRERLTISEGSKILNRQLALFDEYEKQRLEPWRAVKDVLDFSNEGTSIFGRKTPLVDPTLARIYAGLIKFVAGGKDAFLSRYNSVRPQDTCKSLDEPCGVLTTENRFAKVQVSFLSKQFSGHPESKNISIEGPAGAITCKDHHAFISAYYGNGNNRCVEEPAPTVTTKDRFSLIESKFLCSYNFKDTGKDINLPCPTILTKDRLSLVSPFFMNQYSGGGQISDINKPCPAVTTTPKQNLIMPRFIDQQYGQSKPSSPNEPLGCVTANPKYNLVSCKPWIMNTAFNNVGSSIHEPAQTITANRKWHYLMNPQFNSEGSSVENPCFTLIAKMDKRPPYLIEASSDSELPSFIKKTPYGLVYEIYDTDTPITKKIKEFMAMYGIIDIKMRMLVILELLRIMGFPEDYVLVGTQAEKKKYIGNAVEVNMARVLCEALSKKLFEFKKIAA